MAAVVGLDRGQRVVSTATADETSPWGAFLDTLERCLDELDDVGRFPMVVRPPLDAPLPAALAPRAIAVRERMDAAQRDVEAGLLAIEASRARLHHTARPAVTAPPAMLDTRA